MFTFACGVSLVIYWLGRKPLLRSKDARRRDIQVSQLGAGREVLSVLGNFEFINKRSACGARLCRLLAENLREYPVRLLDFFTQTAVIEATRYEARRRRGLGNPGLAYEAISPVGPSSIDVDWAPSRGSDSRDPAH